MICTWNKEFNVLANRAGMTVADLIGLPEKKIACNVLWANIGGRIQVCDGTAVWTVNHDDLIEG